MVVRHDVTMYDEALSCPTQAGGVKMNAQTIQIRKKGQVTLPSDVRRELGWDEGTKIIVSREGDRLVFERPESIVTRLAGSLTAFANPANQYRDIQEIIDDEREAFENAVVEDVMRELEE